MTTRRLASIFMVGLMVLVGTSPSALAEEPEDESSESSGEEANTDLQNASTQLNQITAGQAIPLERILPVHCFPLVTIMYDPPGAIVHWECIYPLPDPRPYILP